MYQKTDDKATQLSLGFNTTLSDEEIRQACWRASLTKGQTSMMVTANRFFGTDQALEMIEKFQKLNQADEEKGKIKCSTN